MSHQSALLVRYMEAYLSDLEWLLREWRIAITVSKSIAMLYTCRCIQKAWPIQLYGELILWVDATHYLGVTLDTLLTWLSHINQVKRGAQRLGALGLLDMRSSLSIRNGILLYKQLICPIMGVLLPQLEICCPFPFQEVAGDSVQVSWHYNSLLSWHCHNSDHLSWNVQTFCFWKVKVRQLLFVNKMVHLTLLKNIIKLL